MNMELEMQTPEHVFTTPNLKYPNISKDFS